jgi:hypothetical protein
VHHGLDAREAGGEGGRLEQLTAHHLGAHSGPGSHGAPDRHHGPNDVLTDDPA